MIDLYTWSTPNGRKASIMLEEVGLPYTVHPINILENDQFSDDFVAINPNSKIPAIVDSDGPGGEPISIFESGAILMYLAEKTDSPLMPKDMRERYQVLQWLMFQMGGFGPFLGQAHHFLRFAKEDIPYAKQRYQGEAVRLYGVLDKHFQSRPYLSGDNYSIADIATYPWAARHEWQQIDLNDFPALKAWYDKISARPAVEKGMLVPIL